MSLAHAIMVSLICEPKSGYDLAKQFDGSVGFFWQATHQQIYRELTKLDRQNWIAAEAIAQEGRPDKKIFSVTDLGLSHLKTWLLQSSEVATVKDEFLLKIYAGYLVPEAEIVNKIQEHRQLHQQQLEIYQAIERNFFSDLQSCSRVSRFAYLTLRRGIIFEQGWITWCDEVLPLVAELSSDLMG
ncbi:MULTISPECIES: PadR family transcriptional regulator [Pseudanabaena]|uniref:Transcriptional regulator, PadR-like family n=2 Tax=Pseudanabaena TaxID=1152 RepID=L8N009_9CYAN|nr:PadR family transcriptional regulator [Pseudanabaena catenata]ELS31583.1 transcriptional regulator, PadR-like family [Pseudanabaena biceps PCC 7429]MDG3496157.1 PadR family transcriptional regulator [Pseudanabaena catenata USMAC16]